MPKGRNSTFQESQGHPPDGTRRSRKAKDINQEVSTMLHNDPGGGQHGQTTFTDTDTGQCGAFFAQDTGDNHPTSNTGHTGGV
jgi:hypothetical protein